MTRNKLDIRISSVIERRHKFKQYHVEFLALNLKLVREYYSTLLTYDILYHNMYLGIMHLSKCIIGVPPRSPSGF